MSNNQDDGFRPSASSVKKQKNLRRKQTSEKKKQYVWSMAQLNNRRASFVPLPEDESECKALGADYRIDGLAKTLMEIRQKVLRGELDYTHFRILMNTNLWTEEGFAYLTIPITDNSYKDQIALRKSLQ